MKRQQFLRITLVTLVVAAVLGVGLLLDLANQGLVWRFIWSQTGEETPLAQIRGIVEWAGNITRPQPVLDPFIPVDHAGDNPFGINTFLHQEVERVKIDAQLAMIADAGFGWIRQPFDWYDIEADGRGQFTDSRNDMDGDGDRDTISGWRKYDWIVDLAEEHGVRIQARVAHPPAWTRAEEDPTGFGPPDDIQDYLNFLRAIAERYQGRITHYQIWNEPNIFPEWGAQPDGTHNPVDPEAYTDLLCRAYTTLKAVDPEIVVISGALAPTNEYNTRNLNDFVFLQRMYDAGAGACFDVLSMQGYGLNSGPTDRRMRPTNVNVSRNLYIREIMVRNGDAHKPIWISEAAWNPVPEDPSIADRLTYGQVTPEQAAQYMPLLYQRFQAEMPWVGVMNYWFFTLPNDVEKGKSWYYFRMVEPDYSPEKPTYTPLPIYNAVRDYITNLTPTLYQGVHQVEGHWALTTGDGTEVVQAAGAQFDEAVNAGTLTFTTHGTDVSVRWQGGDLSVRVNEGQSQTVSAAPGQWHTTTLVSSLLPQTHTLRIEAADDVTVDAVTVADYTARNLLPFVVVGLTMLVMLGVSVMWLRQKR